MPRMTKSRSEQPHGRGATYVNNWLNNACGFLPPKHAYCYANGKKKKSFTKSVCFDILICMHSILPFLVIQRKTRHRKGLEVRCTTVRKEGMRREDRRLEVGDCEMEKEEGVTDRREDREGPCKLRDGKRKAWEGKTKKSIDWLISTFRSLC